MPGYSTITVWYEVPAAHAEHVTDRADPFVVALLFLAIWLEEDIEVEGPLSPHLEYGLREYQRVFASWYERVTPVAIRYDELAPHPDPESAEATATFFSGGVDSFFTLRSHLPEHEPNPAYRITHGLFVHGFDTPLSADTTFQFFYDSYRTLFGELGLELIPVRTNLKDFINDRTCGWSIGHGTFLASIPLLLPGLFSRCYIPASGTLGTPSDIPAGSHPLTDPLLSTESVQLLHDGGWATRYEKTAVLAEWPATYDHLYVCFARDIPSLDNCCRCEKCIRTMTALELAGALDRYTTFPKPLRRRDVRRSPLIYDTQRGLATELLEAARNQGRRALAFDLRYQLFRYRLRHLFIEPLKRFPLLRPLYRWLKRR